jgi:hypothetical protein
LDEEESVGDGTLAALGRTIHDLAKDPKGRRAAAV